jgi:hypothetical protein
MAEKRKYKNQYEIISILTDKIKVKTLAYIHFNPIKVSLFWLIKGYHNVSYNVFS